MKILSALFTNLISNLILNLLFLSSSYAINASLILTMQDKSVGFIPKPPPMPKIKSSLFSKTVVSSYKQDEVTDSSYDIKESVYKDDKDLQLPNAWFFSAGFNSKVDPVMVSTFKKLDSLNLPVFEIYCKSNKNSYQILIGPYFDTDPKLVMNKVTSIIQDEKLKQWLEKTMIATDFKPNKCSFVDNEEK